MVYTRVVEGVPPNSERSEMSVGGLYIIYRIRRMVLPFVRVYGQWVEEHIIPLSEQLSENGGNRGAGSIGRPRVATLLTGALREIWN